MFTALPPNIPAFKLEDLKEERESFLGSESNNPRGKSNVTHPRIRSLAPWVLQGFLLLISFTMLIYAHGLKKESRRQCYNQYNAQSPIADAISASAFVDIDYKYSLWYQSPYKGPPNDAVNKAWMDLMKYGTLSVTASDVAQTGILPNASSVLFPPSAGGGYLAVAGGTHHIHCLHYIWQDHHAAHFPDMQKKKEEIPEMYERHYEHCVDYLRQGIMCNFDTGIIPYNWVRDNQQPTPNGNTRHKCINWDAVQGWLKERAVEMPEGFEWSQPEGVISLDRNP